jgi:hypothetical protein
MFWHGESLEWRKIWWLPFANNVHLTLREAGSRDMSAVNPPTEREDCKHSHV